MPLASTDAPETAFGPGALAGEADPYARYAELRALGPVLRGSGGWLVLGHAEVVALLRSPAARSGFIGALYRAALPPGAARDEMSHRINFLDPPDHGRVRRLVAKAFTPRRVEALRPFVEALCRRLLAPLRDEAEVDLIARFAHPVPSLVISELLGVPVDERERLTALADRVASLLGVGGLASARESALAAAEEMHAFLRALLAERRRAPRDDLFSALLAVDDHERLAEAELLSLAATLYSAGHRTTRDLFANGLAALLARRELATAMRSGELPAAAVVEEFLRYETPTHWVGRRLEAPMTLGGVTLPAGEPIFALLAAANRDPAAYADAECFDPLRWCADPPPPAPVSFAFGAHFCLGASLARMEARVMLETLVDALPDAALADEPLRFTHTGVFRGLEALRVRPDARRPLRGSAREAAARPDARAR